MMNDERVVVLLGSDLIVSFVLCCVRFDRFDAKWMVMD